MKIAIIGAGNMGGAVPVVWQGKLGQDIGYHGVHPVGVSWRR